MRSGFPCTMVLTVYSVLSPATNSSCHRHRRIEWCRQIRLDRKHLRRLDTSNGCQDHTASPSATHLRQEASRAVHIRRSIGKDRNSAVRLRIGQSLTRPRPALRLPTAPDAVASTASCPNVRDDGQRPSFGTGRGSYSFDLPDGLSEIFLRKRLDRLLVICPSGSRRRLGPRFACRIQ
jgi:hypothetical protein